MVKTLPSNAGAAGSIPGQGAKIPHASRPKNQNIKEKQYCNKFNKDLKNGPHQKKKILKKFFEYKDSVKYLLGEWRYKQIWGQKWGSENLYLWLPPCRSLWTTLIPQWRAGAPARESSPSSSLSPTRSTLTVAAFGNCVRGECQVGGQEVSL